MKLKICLYCGDKFNAKNNKNIFCSRDCSNKDKAKWKHQPKKHRKREDEIYSGIKTII